MRRFYLSVMFVGVTTLAYVGLIALQRVIG
jgi:hypothetical protein